MGRKSPKSTRSTQIHQISSIFHDAIPKTHRLESGNMTFRNMQSIFTGLENAFAGPYGPGNPVNRKIIFFYIEAVQKNINSEKKSRSKKKCRKKSTFFFEKSDFFWKCRNFEISGNFSDFSKKNIDFFFDTFFFEKKSIAKKTFFFRSWEKKIGIASM